MRVLKYVFPLLFVLAPTAAFAVDPIVEDVETDYYVEVPVFWDEDPIIVCGNGDCPKK